MLTKFIQIIKQKLEKEDLNILCTDLQFLSLFESNNQKYKIGILNNSRLTGIGTFQFMGCNELILNPEWAGYTLSYWAVNGSDDQIPSEE